MYAVVDMGGTNWKLAVVQNGDVRAFSEYPNRHKLEDLDALPARFEELCQSVDASLSACTAVGASVAEFVDTKRGVCMAPADTHKYLENFALADHLSKLTGLPAVIQNDAKCALLGELHFGVARKHPSSHVLMIALGTGIGSALAINGSIVEGAHGTAGTGAGHIQISSDGPSCHCGRIGCAEAMVSGWSLPSRIASFDGFQDSRLAKFEKLEFRAVCDAVRAEDRFATRVLDSFIGHWASLISKICEVFDPELVVLTGGFTASSDLFLSRLESSVRDTLWRSASAPDFVVASNPKTSALLGASILAEAQTT